MKDPIEIVQQSLLTKAAEDGDPITPADEALSRNASVYLIRALEEAGYLILSKEPTPAMRKAHRETLESHELGNPYADPVAAVIAAAPTYGDKE